MSEHTTRCITRATRDFASTDMLAIARRVLAAAGYTMGDAPLAEDGALLMFAFEGPDVPADGAWDAVPLFEMDTFTSDVRVVRVDYFPRSPEVSHVR